MDTATSSRNTSCFFSLLGLAFVVLACMVGRGDCRGFMYGDTTGRRSLVNINAAGPAGAGLTSVIPDEDDYESVVGLAKNDPDEKAPAAQSPATDSPTADDGTAVFDATKFGAKADGKTNSALSFIRAWKAACNSGMPAKMVIPSGIYVAGPVIFQGPCNNGVPMEIEIQGTIKSYSDISEYTSDEWFGFELIDGLNLKGGVFDGQGENFWAFAGCEPRKPCQHLPITLKFNKAKNIYVEGLTSVNSMGFHIGMLMVHNFTGYKLNISAPDESPNTDGIHISGSDNINITSSVIGTGDDCIGIIQGASNIFVKDVVCGPGHGISIGSLGKWPNEENVQTVRVSNCTLKNTTNGVRIKSFPGNRQLVASDIVFEDIIMDSVKNPVIIDQNYGYHKITKPSSVKIHDVTFRNIRGTTISNNAVALTCSSKNPCQRVQLTDIDLKYNGKPLKKKTFSSSCINAKITVKGVHNPPACTTS